MPNQSHQNVHPTVASLRSEIDRIDDALLDLVERRVAATTAIAALKDGEGEDRLKIRPRREAEVVGRLTRRARRAPPEMVGHLWRTIMSYGLQDQARMHLILHCEGDRLALQAVVRNRFGPAPALRWASCERDALDVARREEAVAIIARDGLPDLADTPLRVFETVLVGDATAYAIGRVAPTDIVEGAVA